MVRARRGAGHRGGPPTSQRVAKADLSFSDDKHNYDCWDTRGKHHRCYWCEGLGLLERHTVGDPHYGATPLVCRQPHNNALLVR